MKRFILISLVVGTVALAGSLLISQNSQNAKSGEDGIVPEVTPTQSPASSFLPPLEDPKVSLARIEKERQEAIERENNPQLPDGVPEVGPGLKRMKRGSQVEVAPQLLASWDCGAWAKNATFSRDDKWLLIGSSPIKIYRTRDWSLLRTLQAAGAASLSPDTKLVAASNAAPQKNALAENAPGVGVWRIRDGKQLRLLNDKSGLVSKVGVWGPVAFSPDGDRILTLGEDPKTKWRPFQGANTEASTVRQVALKVWDVSSGERLNVSPGPFGGAFRNASVAWVRASTRKNGKFEPRFFGGGDGVCQLPDRTLGVQVNWEGYLTIEDLTTKQLIRNLASDDRMKAAALSPDGTLVASGSDGQNIGSSSKFGTIKIWRVADGKLLAKFEGKGGGTSALAFSRDGRKLVVIGRGYDVNSIAAVYAL